MLLSIIIPSYNHAQFVLKTLQAAAAIAIEDKEIIVIDDGSSDSSASLIDEYIRTAGAKSNIQLISRPNRGLVKTLNQGLAIARGKYFYLVASDDIPIPEGITRLVQILEADSRLRFVLGNALLMESEQQCNFRTTYGESHKRFFSITNDQWRKDLFLNYPQPILLQSTVFRTSALKEINGWLEDIISDDMSLFTRMFSQSEAGAQDFAFRPEIIACFYRQHMFNVSKIHARQFQTIEQLLTLLSPAEFRDAALVKNFLSHSVGPLKQGRLLVVMQFFWSTARRVGLIRLLRKVVSASRDLLRERAMRRAANTSETAMTHEPATELLRRMR